MSSELTCSDGHPAPIHDLDFLSASSGIKDDSSLLTDVHAAHNKADSDVQAGISSSVSPAVTTSTAHEGDVPAITGAAIGKSKAVWKFAKETTKEDVDPQTRDDILSILNRIGDIPEDEDDDDYDIIFYTGPVIPGIIPEYKPDPPPRPESFWRTALTNTDYIERFRKLEAEYRARLADARQAKIHARLADADAWLQKGSRDLDKAIPRNRLDAQTLLATSSIKQKHDSLAEESPDALAPPAKKARVS